MAEPDRSRAGNDPDPARRDRRAGAFGGELAAAWRAEFTCLWDRPDADTLVPTAAAFKSRVEALGKLGQRAQLGGVDPQAIQTLAQGLHGAAAQLRAEPTVRKWILGGAIRGEVGSRDAARLAPPGRPAGSPIGQPPPAKPAANGVAVIKEVLAEVGPRLAAVRIAMAPDPTRAPGWDTLPGELKLQVPGLAVALASQPAAQLAAKQALQHHEAAEQALTTPGGAGPERLRGLVLPLNQLHVTFRDLPALARLFPPPRTRALPPAPPAARRPPGPGTLPPRPTTMAINPVKPPEGTRTTGPVAKPPGAAGPAPANAPRSPHAGPLPGAIAPAGPVRRAPPSGPMGGDEHISATSKSRTSTGSLRLAGAATGPTPEAAAKPAPAAEEDWAHDVAPADPASPGEVSKRRMAAIAGYLKDPDADPLLRDPAVIYKLVSDEHSYQQDQAAHLRMLLSLLPETADEARRAQLTTEQAGCAKRQRQLFELLKRITARGRPP